MDNSMNTLGARLQRLIAIPEDQVSHYRYHHDLTYEPKEKWESPVSSGSLLERIEDSTRAAFDQIQELSHALAALEGEIQRNDFAILKNEESLMLITYAIRRYQVVIERGIDWDSYQESFPVRRHLNFMVENLAHLTMGHLPVEVGEDGVLTFNRELTNELNEPAGNGYFDFSKTLALLKTAKSARNRVIQDICNRLLGINLLPYFDASQFVAKLQPLSLDEEDLIALTKLMNPSQEQMEDQPRQRILIPSPAFGSGRYPTIPGYFAAIPPQRPFPPHAPLHPVIDIKLFPGMTLKALQEWLAKIPMLNVVNLESGVDSPLSDMHLMDSAGEVIYANSAILFRSSDYLKFMFTKEFSEGVQFAESDKKQDKKLIMLSDKDFAFIKKWLFLFNAPFSLHPFTYDVPLDFPNPSLADGILTLAEAKRFMLAEGIFREMDLFFSKWAKAHILKEQQSGQMELELEFPGVIEQLQGTTFQGYFRDDLV